MTGLTSTQPVDPWADFAAIPGLGAKLTDRLIHQLGIQTLEQLELAAHTGRLQTVPGIGPRKACAIGRTVAELLVQRRRKRDAKTLRPNARVSMQSQNRAEPSVAQLLIVDREYRRRARAQTLPKVAPRRFNPDGAAASPVYRVQRGNTKFRVFYSNSPTAHALGRTLDWVIVLASNGDRTFQYTVVTETRGSWSGQRVVRAERRSAGRSTAWTPHERSLSYLTPRARRSSVDPANGRPCRGQPPTDRAGGSPSTILCPRTLPL